MKQAKLQLRPLPQDPVETIWWENTVQLRPLPQDPVETIWWENQN
jgi:hypothetical protein